VCADVGHNFIACWLPVHNILISDEQESRIGFYVFISIYLYTSNNKFVTVIISLFFEGGKRATIFTVSTLLFYSGE
jgi:hypothetical protein